MITGLASQCKGIYSSLNSRGWFVLYLWFLVQEGQVQVWEVGSHLPLNLVLPLEVGLSRECNLLVLVVIEKLVGLDILLNCHPQSSLKVSQLAMHLHKCIVWLLPLLTFSREFSIKYPNHPFKAVSFSFDGGLGGLGFEESSLNLPYFLFDCGIIAP